MSRPRLLLDTSGLIALARLGVIEAVVDLIGPIHVTPEVVTEATTGDRPGARAVARAIDEGLLTMLEAIKLHPLSGLGLGETSTIRRASELDMTAVIDDLDARRAAARLGVALTGTVALVVRVAEAMSHPIADTLDELDLIGFRVSPAVRAWALQARDADQTRD